MDNVFVIGDVHGHLDRLEALLKQEGLLVWCEWCQGVGQHMRGSAESIDRVDCGHCKGIGWRRAKTDTTVVQLGDLGHFGAKDSPTGDLLCYKYVTENRWADVVLWGNHDRAQIDEQHAFRGFRRNHEALHYIKMLHDEGRLMLAFAAHDFLITHAGLASAFKHQGVDENLKIDPQAFADWINDEDEAYIEGEAPSVGLDKNAMAIRDAIGIRRGGRVVTGGILWRDINEGLYDGFRQIFGHTANPQIRYAGKKHFTARPECMPPNPSYCIDVGGKNGTGADCLAGIWLPSEKVVRVDL